MTEPAERRKNSLAPLYATLVVVCLIVNETTASQQDELKSATTDDYPPAPLSQAQVEKQALVVELLKQLHRQYAGGTAGAQQMEQRQSQLSSPRMMSQLFEALGAEGDMPRLIDWIRNSFRPASIAEVSTQFVVSKLGAVNCPALLQPDKEEMLVPRFLLFNEHYVDVPYELSISPTPSECLRVAKFDPRRKTIVMIHGYLGGYTLTDDLINVKNRLLDLNRFASEKAIQTFVRTSQQANSSYVFTEDLNLKIRSQLYNVIIIDWFTGANPTPRADYIRAAVNAQVVGKLIGRFLSALIAHCGAQAADMQIIAHSLGCHVAGFTGKAMNAAGHRLGKITHLDPVGLCFGRLFSKPQFRLSPSDALDTQAVHVSLNIFDNPLDGAHRNFLVNGGRDQPGCGGQNEVKNSTVSSVSILFDPAARFAPCSHLRAYALFEDDHSSEPAECQHVGYRCPNYDRFLAGECGQCDSLNTQCRLMGLQPLSLRFRKLTLAPSSELSNYHYDSLGADKEVEDEKDGAEATSKYLDSRNNWHHVNSGADWLASNGTMREERRPEVSDFERSQVPSGSRQLFGMPAYFVGDNKLARRSGRRLADERRERIALMIDQLRANPRFAWTNLRPILSVASNETLKVTMSMAASGAKGNHLVEGSHGEETDAEGDEESATSVSSATVEPTSPMSTTTSTPPAALFTTTSQCHGPTMPGGMLAHSATQEHEVKPEDRFLGDGFEDQVPLGSQATPAGSLNGPLYFLGTSSLSPYCVNYYHFRVLIAESRLKRVMQQNGLASNRLKAQYNQHPGSILRVASRLPQQVSASGGRDMLHLTIKLIDSLGHFFKGFSLLESAHLLRRAANDPSRPVGAGVPLAGQPAIGINEPMFEITMLLNSTHPRPIRVSETIISYYFHPIVMADRVEVSYMSNISPEIRARYTSVLCPASINDRHQLVRYIECHKVSRRKK